MQTDNGYEVTMRPFATPEQEHCINLNLAWCPNGHWVDMILRLTEDEAEWLRLCLASAVQMKREYQSGDL